MCTETGFWAGQEPYGACVKSSSFSTWMFTLSGYRLFCLPFTWFSLCNLLGCFLASLSV